MGTFHAGEQALQERAGVRERLAHAAFIRDHMPEQHRQFFRLLPFIVAGSVDAQGQPWASALCGPPGFVSSPDPRTLEIAAAPAAHDPLAGALRESAALGLLGIQPHTRRRNRMNGHVVRVQPGGFQVRVDQSFGNCPKYIQAREPSFTGGSGRSPRVRRMDTLDARAEALVRAADTFFVASAHPRAGSAAAPADEGVDVSHRGGKPGFLRVDDGRALTFPDFTGNSFYNTLGNLQLEPRCGLLLMDFGSGDSLQVCARAEIVEQGREVEAFRGALRLVRLHVQSAILAERALPLRWGPAQLSPVLEATGRW